MKKSTLFIFSLYLALATQFTVSANDNTWNTRLKDRYNLSETQISELRSQGYSYQDINRAGELSGRTNRSVEDILRLRRDNNYTLGDTRRNLGVPNTPANRAPGSVTNPNTPNNMNNPSDTTSQPRAPFLPPDTVTPSPGPITPSR